MSAESPDGGEPKKKKKKRLGVGGYIRAMVLARTAAVSWPEAKEMARSGGSETEGPVDIVRDSERPAGKSGPR